MAFTHSDSNRAQRIRNTFRFDSCVSFCSHVGQFRHVSLLPSSSLVLRPDYLSGVTVTPAVGNAGDGSIVPPPSHTDLRETCTPISIASAATSLSSRSPLEVVLPYEQLRAEPLWAAVFVKEVVRVKGWRLHENIELLVYRTSASGQKCRRPERIVRLNLPT